MLPLRMTWESRMFFRDLGHRRQKSQGHCIAGILTWGQSHLPLSVVKAMASHVCVCNNRTLLLKMRPVDQCHLGARQECARGSHPDLQIRIFEVSPRCSLGPAHSIGLVSACFKHRPREHCRCGKIQTTATGRKWTDSSQTLSRVAALALEFFLFSLFHPDFLTMRAYLK